MANQNNQNNKQRLRHCSFCGRDELSVEFLIPSPEGAYICDCCIETCSELIAEHRNVGTNEKKKIKKHDTKRIDS